VIGGPTNQYYSGLLHQAKQNATSLSKERASNNNNSSLMLNYDLKKSAKLPLISSPDSQERQDKQTKVGSIPITAIYMLPKETWAPSKLK